MIQDEIKEWSQRNFPDSPAWRPLVGVSEEVGELDHHFLKMQQGIRVTEDHVAGIVDAVGDIAIYLMDFCWKMGLDYDLCIKNTWDKVKQRDWTRHKENGVG